VWSNQADWYGRGAWDVWRKERFDVENWRKETTWEIFCWVDRVSLITNSMHCLSSVYWVITPLHFSGLSAAHHQELEYIHIYIDICMWQMVLIILCSWLSADLAFCWLLWTWWWTFRFYRVRGIYWLTEKLLASGVLLRGVSCKRP
jgi:hypothetical protein